MNGLLGQERVIETVTGQATELLNEGDKCLMYLQTDATGRCTLTCENGPGAKGIKNIESWSYEKVLFKGQDREVMRSTVMFDHDHHLLVIYPNPGPDVIGDNREGKMSGYILEAAAAGETTLDLLSSLWDLTGVAVGRPLEHDGTYHSGN